MPRVVYFTGHTSNKIGGLEDQIVKLNAAADKDILFVENDYDTVPETVKSFFRDNEVDVGTLPTSRNPLRVAINIYRILKRSKPKVVHVNFQPVSYIAAVVAGLTGIGHRYWTKHTMLNIKRFSRTWWYHAIAMVFVDHVFCVSEAGEAELAQLGLGNGKRSVLQIGVDLNRFRPGRLTEDERDRIRDELGIRDGDFVVTVVAQIRPVKRLDTFLDAVDILVNDKKLVQVKAFVVGGTFDDDACWRLEDEYRRRVETAGLSRNVFFLGVRDDVEDIYSVSHLAGLTSAKEGLPLALIEAAASGLPLFGTNICGNPEVVREAQNGVLFEVGDAARLASEIARLIENRSLREQLAVGSRHLVEERFDMDRQVERLAQFYVSRGAPHEQT